MYKLLIADDEHLERQALCYIIKKHCSRISLIEEASNGREAISKSSSFQPDILLMDIKMPGINGIEAAKSIKEMNPGCRILFLTAFDYFEYAREAIKIGVENFIVKPADDDMLVETLNSIVEKLDMELKSKGRQKDAEHKLVKVTSFLENEIVYSLLIGEIDKNEVSEFLSMMGIEFRAGFAAALTIDFHLCYPVSSTIMQKEMTAKRCMEKLRDELAVYGFHCLLNHSHNNINMLAIPKDIDKREVSVDDSFDMISRTCKSLYENLNIYLRAGIGNCYSDLDLMRRSFSQAKIANKHKNQVTHFNHIQKNGETFKYPIEKEKKLCEKIIRFEEDEVLSLSDDILDWVFNSFDEIEDMRIKIYELIFVINRAVSNEFKGWDIQTSFKSLQQIHTPGELRLYVKEALRRLISEISLLKQDRSIMVIQKVCEYISQNYMRDISLEGMAEMVNFSSFYFSKIFKDYKNMNFIEYLTEVRIKKGKELLKNPTINIKDVSNLIGYGNPDYFARVFKRSVGLTPTEYRNNKLKL